MKNTSYRRFDIECRGNRPPFRFAVHESADGSLQVTRISPYDETEYHWAAKAANRNHWRIIREGRVVSTISPFIGCKADKAAEPLSPEQVAYFLIKADQEANLEPSINHN